MRHRISPEHIPDIVAAQQLPDPDTSPDQTKRCTGCKRLLFKTDFFKRSASPDGLQYRCWACMAYGNPKEQLQWVRVRSLAKKFLSELNPVDIQRYPPSSRDFLRLFKVCPLCRQELPRIWFYHRKGSKDGRSSRCKRCYRQHPSYVKRQKRKELG